jgi:hypothetical protein
VNSQKDKSLVDIWKETYPKIRPWVALILVGTFLTSFLSYNSEYKIVILFALASNIVFLIFDLANTIKTRLDRIESNLKEPEPPSYVDFNEALVVIKGVLSDRLSRNRDVKIKILSVSAQFSWKALVDTAIPVLLKSNNYRNKISIEIGIVKPSVLRDWGQQQLENDASNTLKGEKIFKSRHRSDFENKSISLEIYQYDNIPHWHGVLIDDDLLFMGRCKWELIDERYHLLAGQIDYRQFRVDDRFGGTTRIELVNNWFDTYKFRAGKISQTNNIPTR